MDRAAPVTADEFRLIAARIQEIATTPGVNRTLEIGRLILDRFFAGDASLLRGKGRRKAQSIRRLAELPGCPLGKSALAEAVGIYVLSRRLHELGAVQHIKPSHLAAVLALPDPQSTRLLIVAEREQWSVRRLRGEVAALKSAQGGRRASRGGVEHLARQLLGLTGRLDAALAALVALERPRPESGPVSAGTRQQLAQLRCLCEAMLETLGRLELGAPRKGEVYVRTPEEGVRPWGSRVGADEEPTTVVRLRRSGGSH